MMIRLALRNILRNKLRTALTLGAIAFGLMFLIILDALLSGMDQESFERIINYETGHIKIFAKDYYRNRDDLPLNKSINQPQPIIAGIKNDPSVAGITSRLNFRLMLSDGIDQLPAMGIAIDPANDQGVFLLKQAVSKGEFLTVNEEAMLLGKGLAEDFGVDVGDTLTILARTRYETIQALDLTIKGILETEDPKIDWMAAVIPLRLGQGSLDLGQAVTEIGIRLKDPQGVNEFRNKLAKKMTGMEIMTWKELAEDLLAVSATKHRVSFMLFGSVVLIALIGISNTILLGAFERTKEIGVMRALGMRRREIIRLFVLEGAMIGFLGSTAGCIAGIIVNLPLIVYGINWGFMMRDIGVAGYRLTSVSHSAWRPGMILATFIFGVIISGLVSIYPAWVASRMEATEALRK